MTRWIPTRVGICAGPRCQFQARFSDVIAGIHQAERLRRFGTWLIFSGLRFRGITLLYPFTVRRKRPPDFLKIEEDRSKGNSPQPWNQSPSVPAANGLRLYLQPLGQL